MISQDSYSRLILVNLYTALIGDLPLHLRFISSCTMHMVVVLVARDTNTTVAYKRDPNTLSRVGPAKTNPHHRFEWGSFGSGFIVQ